jgi:hypothetical protein
MDGPLRVQSRGGSRSVAERLSKPRQRVTGSRGYLGNVGSVAESVQSQKVELRADVSGRACPQSAQRPGVGALARGVTSAATVRHGIHK